MTLARPPRDIDPKAFFEEWLPAQAQEIAAPATPMTVRVALSGADGGTWDLVLGPGGLKVATRGGGGGGGEPEVTIAQSTQDWRAIVHGEEGAANLAPERSRPTDMLFLDPAAQAVVRTAKGTFRFEVTGYHGRTWALTVKLGDRPLDESKPDATIRVDAETYAQILARTLPAPAAFFNGKIQVLGDMQMAMQLGMALMPRFGS